MPNSATKKTKIDINDTRVKKKSLTRADIERLNSGGLIGDGHKRSPSGSPNKSGRSSRRNRGESKLEKLKSKYGQKRDSTMSNREGSIPRIKAGFTDPVLNRRKSGKKITTTSALNPPLESQWSTAAGNKLENIN